MKKSIIATAAIFSALTLLPASTLAKAHDQGVADGDRDAQEQPADPGVAGGIGALVNEGARGDGASTAKSGNKTEPVVNNSSDE